MSNSSTHHDHGEPRPATHAFVLLGDQTVYGCHLGMFHMPEHHYQVIIQVTLGRDDKYEDAREKYLKEQKLRPAVTFVVINPPGKEMLLPEMLDKRSFPAEIWAVPDTDFAKKEIIVTGLTVTIDKVLYDRKFNPEEIPPVKPRYLLFGSSDRAHMTHYMTKDPDYQLTLDLDSISGLTSEQLANGVLIDLKNIQEHHKPESDPLCVYRGKHVDYTLVDPGIMDYTIGKLEIGATHSFDVKILNSTDPVVASAYSGLTPR